MAQVCDICGKGPQFGNNISHAHNVTKRRWNVNLQAGKGTGKRQSKADSRVRQLHQERQDRKGIAGHFFRGWRSMSAALKLHSLNHPVLAGRGFVVPSYCAAVFGVVAVSASGFSQGNADASSPCGDQRLTTALASFPRVCSASLSPVQR